jgi:Tfp pilus assembly protein PilV
MLGLWNASKLWARTMAETNPADELERWAKECPARANYCGWAATVTTDKDYRNYLLMLAAQWKQTASKQHVD